MKTLTFKLSRYLMRQYMLNFLGLMLLLLGVILLFDTIELIRRSSEYNLSFGLIAQMALLKLPEVGQMLLPFGILFSAMYTFWKMTRNNELIVIRATGFSIWQFLMPVLFCGLMIGLLSTTIINPISAVFLKKFEKMEVNHLRKTDSLLNISKNGIWLKQETNDGYNLLRAAQFNPETWELSKVIVFYFTDDNIPQQRIDAQTAKLQDGFWQLQQAHYFDIAQTEPLTYHHYKIPTEITSRDIEDSFADPQTLSFWEIPSFIDTLEATGFPATRMKVHFQSLLAQPLLFLAMILLASSVSLRPSRFGGTIYFITLGVIIGFLIFFIENFLHAFGISQKIPVFLAAWAPAVISFLLGLTSLLYLEDG